MAGNGSQSRYYSEKGEKTGLRVIELTIVKGRRPAVSAKPAGAVPKGKKKEGRKKCHREKILKLLSDEKPFRMFYINCVTLRNVRKKER